MFPHVGLNASKKISLVIVLDSLVLDCLALDCLSCLLETAKMFASLCLISYLSYIIHYILAEFNRFLYRVKQKILYTFSVKNKRNLFICCLNPINCANFIAFYLILNARTFYRVHGHRTA